MDLFNQDISDSQILNLAMEAEKRVAAEGNVCLVPDFQHVEPVVSEKDASVPSVDHVVEIEMAGGTTELVDKAEDPSVDVVDSSAKTLSDMSLVFGPGATGLDLDAKKQDMSTSKGSSSSSREDTVEHINAEISTPVRNRSRGRRRARNSGRSSFSSPSPIRPPNIDSGSKKLRYDSEGEEIGDPGGSDNLQSGGTPIQGDKQENNSCTEVCPTDKEGGAQQ